MAVFFLMRVDFSRGKMFKLCKLYPRVILRIMPPNHIPELYILKSRLWMLFLEEFGITLTSLILLDPNWLVLARSDDPSLFFYVFTIWVVKCSLAGWLCVIGWLARWLTSGVRLAGWLCQLLLLVGWVIGYII